MDLRIAGKVALVAGSSSGLGLAIATTLAEEGCRVALNGRDEERLAKALPVVARHAGGDVESFIADVSDIEQAANLVDRVRHHFGRVDILVCNAGGPPTASFEDLPADAWQAALDLNLLSTIHLCRAAVPIMRRAQWGRIVCLTSIAARQPLEGLMLSTTARAGVLGFSKSLADQVAPDGITVNAICPGYMHTDRLADLLRRQAVRTRRSEDEVEERLVLDIPIGRMGRPEELAAVVAFLVSEQASYITGVALPIDGGFIRSII